ncbi:MAG: 4Fe-4S dicluster domain-containing protein [Desulfobacterales bacterium]
MDTFGLSIDNSRCWGCKTCEVACKQENKAADGVKLIWVEEIGPGLDSGKPDLTFQVNRCRHCDDPPCVEACPEGAISRREDRIVMMDHNLCTGCQACIDSCPYNAIGFDDNKVIAQKCNLCYHRVDRGLIPACADNICPAHCIHFGH